MLFVVLLIQRKCSYFVHGTGQVMRSLVYCMVLSASYTIVQQGRPTFLDKEPHILLRAGSRAARVKIKSVKPNVT